MGNLGGLNWTEEQWEEYQARRNAGKGRLKPSSPVPEPDEAPEAKLQARIETYCADRGLYCFHDRSRKKNDPGFPDCVIACRAGRVVWLELKSKCGRLRPDQRRVRDMLIFCGHEWHLVRSYRHFIQIMEIEEGSGDAAKADKD